MLGWRLFLSAILIPLLFGIFYLDHRIGEAAPLLLVFCLLVALRSMWELAGLLRVRSFNVHVPATALCTLLVTGSAWIPHWTAIYPEGTCPTADLGITMVVYVVTVLFLFLLSAARYREPGRSMETLGTELFIVGYIGVLLSLTAQLRWVAGAQAGYLVIGSMIVAAKCGDSGAYFLGRYLGKRKLAPLLSPGKTWMGALGTLLGSGLGGWAWLQFATPQFQSDWQPPAWYWSLLFGVVIGVAGLVGDLCESLVKRDTGKKDSAPLMPGLGGVLDLLDSILFAGPVAYFLWLVLPLATWR